MGKFFCGKTERPEAKPEKFVYHPPENRKQRIEQPVQEEKISRHTHGASRQQKQPQISATNIKPHGHQTQKCGQQKKQIRQRRQKGDAPPQGPQEIVKQAEYAPQPHRQDKPQKLAGNRRRH